MRQRVDSLPDLLSPESEGGSDEPFLFFPESVRADGLLLRFLYPGGVQDRILYDYIPDIPGAADSGADALEGAAQAVSCRSDCSFWMLFSVAFKGDVCDRCEAVAISELDF